MNMQICPYCGKELEQGTLRSRGGNYFLPDGENVPLLSLWVSPKGSRGINLPPDPFSPGTSQLPTAYACRACQKIIIPYE